RILDMGLNMVFSSIFARRCSDLFIMDFDGNAGRKFACTGANSCTPSEMILILFERCVRLCRHTTLKFLLERSELIAGVEAEQPVAGGSRFVVVAVRVTDPNRADIFLVEQILNP